MCQVVWRTHDPCPWWNQGSPYRNMTHPCTDDEFCWDLEVGHSGGGIHRITQYLYCSICRGRACSTSGAESTLVLKKNFPSVAAFRAWARRMFSSTYSLRTRKKQNKESTQQTINQTEREKGKGKKEKGKNEKGKKKERKRKKEKQIKEEKQECRERNRRETISDIWRRNL